MRDIFFSKGGEIPDAKTIHYIRKQREMARNSEDFLVLEQADEDVSASGTSRLIRFGTRFLFSCFMISS